MNQPAEHELAALQRVPVMIWRSSRPDGSRDWFNAGWLDFRGRSLEDEVGVGWLDGIHPADRLGCLTGLREAFEARRPVVLEYRMRRHDGEWRWVEDPARPVETSDGAFGGFVGACHDVTARRQTVDRLTAADASRTLLLQTVFHDVGAPIAAARAALDLMPAAPGDESAEMLAVATDQLQRAERILDGVRDIHLAEEGRLQPRAVNVALDGLLDDLARGVAADGHHVEVSAPPVTARLDPTLTERIVDNLLLNAVTHTPAGTHIRLDAAVDRRGVELVVEDDGPGVDEALLPELFEPYRRGERRRGRLGLGLSLVRSYARAHGGEVEACNVTPHGARFTVWLPQP